MLDVSRGAEPLGRVDVCLHGLRRFRPAVALAVLGTMCLVLWTAAAMLGVSPRSVWTLAASGELPSVRIGRRKLYRVETLQRWIVEREGAGRASRDGGVR